MIQFVLRKTMNKRWLALCLLIGNMLFVAIAGSSPMYTAAAKQRMLTDDLGRYGEEQQQSPAIIQVFAPSAGADDPKFEIEQNLLEKEIPEAMQLTPACMLKNLYYEEVALSFTEARSDSSGEIKARVGYLADLPEHSTMLSGRMYSSERAEDGAIEVVISQKCMVSLHLLVGDELTMDGFSLGGEPVRLRVVGVYTNSEDADAFWFKSPGMYYRDLMMEQELFERLFIGKSGSRGVRALMFLVFDYMDFQAKDAQTYLAVSETYKTKFKEELKDSYKDMFSDIVSEYLHKAVRVEVTLRILQVPIYALLCAFMFMVSRQMVEMEADEISVIKSRGAGRAQIIGIYTLQSLMLALLGLILGIPLAMALCQAVGSANAFLEFVSRRALQLSVDRTVLQYAAGAAALSVLFMVLPVFRYSSVTIVGRKQAKGTFGNRPVWQKLFLDIVCLGVSLYGLYAFYGQREALVQKVQEGAGLDPLLFLCSSLFMIGAGLFCLRLIPLLHTAVYRIGRKFWSPPLYTALLYVIRTRFRQGHILLFLIVTIALGIFNAQTARTINQNETDRIMYTYGADLVLQEQWKDNSAMVEDDPTGMLKIAYTEPDFGRYQTLAGAESVTKVLWNEKGAINNRHAAEGGYQKMTATVVGINTKEFGETVEFKTSLLDRHWFEYLNAISRKSNAILVSENLAEQGYQLGDVLTYYGDDGFSARGIIYGFMPYFPGFVPSRTETTQDGDTVEISNYLVVANLGYLQSVWGVTPYQIWMRAEDTTDFIYEFAEENAPSYVVFRDAKAALIDVKNDPVIQGTNGILTVGFVVALLLCAVGFLIYWILSVSDRALQFGIYRAMGMSMKEIIVMLICEQICISVLGVAAGTGVGILTSRLYIPLVQLAYAPADTVIPLETAGGQSDILRLLLIVGGMILICVMVLGILVRRIQISQALKLGED